MTMHAHALSPTQPLLDLLDAELDRHEGDHFVGPNGERAPRRLWEQALLGPLREFLARPGKEFRARLVEASFRLGGGGATMPEELPILVELLHAGSLIIDDIEDESGYRRGGRALHCMVGLPTALNAGNWLYFWPDVLLDRMGLGPATELALRRTFARTMFRCHNGQGLDLSTRVTELEQREIHQTVAVLTSLKTGALMELAASSGAVASGATSDRVRAISEFGRRLGVGLQMLDDLGGLTSERRRHKGHEDLVHARATWAWAWVAEATSPEVFAEVAALGRLVHRRDRHPEYLAEEMRNRLGPDPKRRARRYLDASIAQLAKRLGPHPVISSLRQEIATLVRSYE